MPLYLIVTLIILIVIILLVTLGTFYFYRIGIARRPKEFLIDSPQLEQPTLDSELPVSDTAWIDAQPFEILEMKSYDNLLLKGFYLPAPVPTGKTVILAHGYNGTAKENMGSLARFYHGRFGWNIFMPDARGHGESEGNYIGFGWHERKDYVKWIYTLIQKIGENTQIVLHGISMGGATVLMTSGEPLPEQVKCIVADCAYTSAYDILCYQLKSMYKLSPFPFVPLTSLLCKWRAGYSFKEASALEQVKKTHKPILFIHGDNDLFVPTSMVYPLYNACPTEKELVLIPGAGHGMAYFTDKQGYMQAVQQFVERFVK